MVLCLGQAGYRDGPHYANAFDQQRERTAMCSIVTRVELPVFFETGADAAVIIACIEGTVRTVSNHIILAADPVGVVCARTMHRMLKEWQVIAPNIDHD